MVNAGPGFAIGCFHMLRLLFFIFGVAAARSADPFMAESSLHSSTERIPQWEYNALYDIYLSTQGIYWRWRNTTFGSIWNFTGSVDPCADSWQGLNCTNAPDIDNYIHITGLNLTAYKMVGTLPASIGNLTALTELVLTDNLINGTLPSSVGDLYNLTTLRLDSNVFHGTIPSTLSQLQQLQFINIGGNDFSGSIEPVICGLTLLQGFYASDNYLEGTLPGCIGSVTSLQGLDLSYNFIVGSLPLALTTLQNLTSLQLYKNRLTSTIPGELGQLTKLTVLTLGENYLSGTLPAGLSALTSLMYLDLSYNVLQSSIPTYLGTFTSLYVLNLGGNRFTGTVPTNFAALQQLQELIVYTNQLSGPLPVVPCALHNLTYLDLGSNAFTGPIDACYGEFPNIHRLYLDINQLTSTLPSSLCNLNKLRYLYLRQNELSGTLPACIGSWSHLETLYLYVNQFTGVIPDEWTNLPAIQYVDVGGNFLQGTIPFFLAANETLQYFYINDNYLTGTIPDRIDQLPHFRELLAQANLLTGSLPTSLSRLVNLSVLSVDYNYLSGILDGVFNATTQRSFTTLKMNDNQFSGTLPDEIFRLPSLSVVVAAGNCLETLLPQSLCNASILDTLSLDGMHTAKTCRRKILPGISAAYASRGSDDHALLECLFFLPRLQTLHLSGNSITGTLPDVDVLPTRLVDLALSHNKLIGTIPVSYQQKIWFLLDLSYNRMSGTLRSDFATSLDLSVTDDAALVSNDTTVTTALGYYALSLENNRLSGKIPGVVVEMLNVSVLGSNLFSCDLMRSDLPRHDSESSTYNCGSTAFDVPFYTWLVLSGVSVIVTAGGWWYFQAKPDLLASVELCKGWLRVASGRTQPGDRDRDPHLVYTALLNHVCVELCRTALLCTAYIFLVLLPVYVALSTYYGTMTYQYTYKVAAAFLSGPAPAALELVHFTVLVVVFVICVVRTDVTARSGEQSAQSLRHAISQVSVNTAVAADTSIAMWVRNAAIYTAFGLLNVFVVAGVNIAYVYVVLYKSANLLLLAQIAIAVFKFLWNGFGAHQLVHHTRIALYGREAKQISSQLETRFIMLQVLNALLNNIVIPCVVVALVSPSCYYNLFFPAPNVETPFTYVLCTDFVQGKCTTREVVFTNNTYAPSFSYSYQCSSSIITSYAPAFVVLCIIAGFIMPVAEVVACYLHRAYPSDTFIYRLVDYNMPSILKPVVASSPPVDSTRRFTKINRLVVAVTSYVAMLLTFGAMFPLLAATLTVTLLVVVFAGQLKIGRFLAAALECNRHDAVHSIEEEVRRAGLVSVLWRSSWLLVTVSCLFYALFLFDTLGDAVGLHKAYWVLIVMPLLPVVIYAGFVATLRFWVVTTTVPSERVADSKAAPAVELPAIGTEFTPAETSSETYALAETVSSLHLSDGKV